MQKQLITWPTIKLTNTDERLGQGEVFNNR